jgi:hypothetical protein
MNPHTTTSTGDLVTTKTFPLSGPIDLHCRLGYGSITVHADEGVSEAKVQLTPHDPSSDALAQTVVELRSSTLLVHGRKPRGTVFDLPVFVGRAVERDAVDVEVTVPSGTPVKISSYGADIVVLGRIGTADIASGTASTRLDHVDGDLRLRYGSGPAFAQRVSGSVVVKSGSGAATFGEVGGALTMACGTGSLDVGVAHGAVRMRTGSGQATIAVAENDVEFGSGSGGLSVGLRAGQSARLDVLTGSGQLRSDLPVADSPPAAHGRAITVRARTGSGDIRVFRAEPTVPADKIA